MLFTKKFYSSSLRLKLLIGSLVPILIVSISILIFYPQKQEKDQRQLYQKKVEGLNKILGIGVGLALDAGNLDGISESFNWVKSDPEVKLVKLYDEHNNSLAEYFADSLYKKNTSSLLTVTDSVVYRNNYYGSIELGYSLEQMNSSISSNTYTTMMIIAIIILFSIVLSFVIANLILKPINSLKQAVELFSIQPNKVVPINSRSQDEIKVLSDSFEEMMSSIVENVKLQEEKTLAEKKTAEDLEKINKELVVTDQKLKDSLSEKETLLKEIHHRVKNNMQVITSLLSLQSSYVDDELATSLLKSSQYRIKSMAMVHEMLYQTGDLSKINYATYLKQLINELATTMKGSNSNIKINIDVPDLHIGMDTAIPLGLLINEVVTNAMKYGLKNNPGDELTVRMRRIELDKYLLCIGDNGAGFSDELNFRNSKSLGLRLIHNLTLQLQGTIEKDSSKKGTNYIINFKEVDASS